MSGDGGGGEECGPQRILGRPGGGREGGKRYRCPQGPSSLNPRRSTGSPRPLFAAFKGGSLQAGVNEWGGRADDFEGGCEDFLSSGCPERGGWRGHFRGGGRGMVMVGALGTGRW